MFVEAAIGSLRFPDSFAGDVAKIGPLPLRLVDVVPFLIELAKFAKIQTEEPGSVEMPAFQKLLDAGEFLSESFGVRGEHGQGERNMLPQQATPDAPALVGDAAIAWISFMCSMELSLPNLIPLSAARECRA
jgi:hypothetical protein